MAKPKADETYEKFLADVLKEVPEDRRGAVEEAIKGSKVLREGVLAREDYSRNQDALRDERTKFDGEVAEARTKIKGWEDWHKDKTVEYGEKDQQLAKYKEEFGDLESDDDKGGKRSAKRQPETYSKDEFQKELSAALTSGMKFMSELQSVQLRHFTEFKEMLDADALIKSAAEKNLPLSVAHEQMVADKRKARAQEDLDVRIKKEREEAVAEFQQQHKFPVVTTSSAPHPLDLAKQQAAAKQTGADERVSAAVSDFMKSYTGGPIG